VPQAKAAARPTSYRVQGYANGSVVQQHDGNPLLINFWATWWGEPCRDEYPMLMSWHKSMRHRDWRLLGVNAVRMAI